MNRVERFAETYSNSYRLTHCKHPGENKVVKRERVFLLLLLTMDK